MSSYGMGAIAFGGLATGLDTGTIVSQLVAIRRQPIVKLEAQKSILGRQQAALNDLKAKLKALQAAAEAIDTEREFGSFAATSSLASVLTATGSGTAAPGTYSIVVEALAQAQKDISQGYASATADVGSGTFTITVDGESHELTLAPGASSLADLRAAINNAGLGVSASLLNTGAGETPYRLTLTSTTTGEDAAFTADFSGLSGGIAPLLSNVAAATNASLTIDGIPITAQSNSVTGVIEGVTLSLHAADPSAPVTLTLDTDAGAITTKVKALVDAYNDLMSFVTAQSADGGTLRGNGLMRSVRQRIAGIWSQSLSGGSGDLTMLAQIGIKQGENGQVTFDQVAFADALGENFGGVRDLLIERDANLGKAYLLRTAIASLTDNYTGLFKLSDTALKNKVEAIDNRIERYEMSIENYRTVLERKFTAMEMMVSRLRAQSGYFGTV